jgi:hypothetical protein
VPRAVYVTRSSGADGFQGAASSSPRWRSPSRGIVANTIGTPPRRPAHAWKGAMRQARGRHEQTEQHEEADLGKPGVSLQEAAHHACVGDPGLSHDEPGEVCGAQAGASERRHAGVAREREADDQHRCDACGGER